MSPTIHSSIYKTGDPSKFKVASIRRNVSGTDPSSTNVLNNGNRATTSTSPLKSQREQEAEFVRLSAGDMRVQPSTDDKSRANFLRVASSETLHKSATRDEVTGLRNRPAFSVPQDSVVLPVSTSTSDFSADQFDKKGPAVRITDQNQIISNGVSTKTINTKGSDNATEDMTKTLSRSEADALIGRGGSPRGKAPDHVTLSEPCLYSHRIFTRAAAILTFLQHDDANGEEVGRRQDQVVVEGGDAPEIHFENPQEQIKTFELTFATLKFQKLFHGILEQTGFFTDYPGYLDSYSLVCIILFDLQSRKFQKRKPFPNEETDELCCEIEDALLSKKTRLQSHIAKERIKHSAPSIEYLLPEQVRMKDETKTSTPVYLWVNQMKTMLEETITELEVEGFTRLVSGEDISEQTGLVFQVDMHCSDLLIFPPHLDMHMKETNWVKSGHLVQQDKSSCLAPQSVEHLLGIDQDVIHVNVGTGVTTAHLASLLRHKSPHSHIWGFGVDSADKAKKAAKNLDFLGAKNTKILMDNFLSVDPDEAKLRSVRVIMISANCSKSAITSPVQFIVSEGEDMRFLGELSKGDEGMASVTNLMLEHEKIIRHALKFPRVQAVVYVTRSRYEAENELLVARVLDYVNASNNNRGVPFRVTPPVLPFSSDEIDSGASGVDDRYIRFLPSDKSNGCFVAVISREPEDPKDAARTAIARARSKGLLGRAKSVTQISNDAESVAADKASAGLKRSKSGSRKLKGTVPRHPGHKSASAISTRLYQAGLEKMKQQAKQDVLKPEHMKIIRHPAPFR